MTWSLDFGKVELKRTGIASKNPRGHSFPCVMCAWMKIYSHLQNLKSYQTFDFDLNQQKAFSLVLNFPNLSDKC